MYIRNDAVDVAQEISGLRLRVESPEAISPDSPEVFQATLTANGSVELEYGVQATTETDISLSIVPGSACIITSGEANAAEIEDRALFTEEGLLLGYDALDGILPGGKVVEVIYYVETASLATEPTAENLGKWSEDNILELKSVIRQAFRGIFR